MKLTKEQLKQIIKEELAGLSEAYDEDETYTDPRDRWMHEFLPVIQGAKQDHGIPDEVPPSEVLKLAIGLIGGTFGGDIELAKAVAEAGAQEQSAMAPGYLKNKKELGQWVKNFLPPEETEGAKDTEEVKPLTLPSVSPKRARELRKRPRVKNKQLRGVQPWPDQ